MSENKQNQLEQNSCDYHSKPVPGKLKVLPSKPCATQGDLSLA